MNDDARDTETDGLPPITEPPGPKPGEYSRDESPVDVEPARPLSEEQLDRIAEGLGAERRELPPELARRMQEQAARLEEREDKVHTPVVDEKVVFDRRLVIRQTFVDGKPGPVKAQVLDALGNPVQGPRDALASIFIACAQLIVGQGGWPQDVFRAARDALKAHGAHLAAAQARPKS